MSDRSTEKDAKCDCDSMGGRFGAHHPECPWQIAFEEQARAEGQTESARRRLHLLTTDLHTYVVPVSPKMLLETLCVVEFALNELERQRPGYNAGGRIERHLERVRALMSECQRKRPTGVGGKHDSLHTDECGCTPERSR